MLTAKNKHVAAVCAFCLVGLFSHLAQAENDCPKGSLAGGVYSNLVITGDGANTDCFIVNVLVEGDIVAKNMDQISVVGSVVNGKISITNSINAFVKGTVVNGDGLTAWKNAFSTVVDNTVNSGDLSVNDQECFQDQEATVESNEVYRGTLRVNCNEKAVVRDNRVRDGDIICRDNDRLDSFDNDARFGNVNCNRSIGD